MSVILTTTCLPWGEQRFDGIEQTPERRVNPRRLKRER